MNSISQNLREQVVSSLHELQQNEKAAKAATDAAMFSLYYAQSASVTTANQLKIAEQVLIEKAGIKHEAANVNGCIVDIVDAADQFNHLAKRSVADVAVCAAAVQKAANAIVQLAGDMGNISSIINAADADSDIYVQAKEIYDLITQVAYDAEAASQTAMKSSVATSEVPGQAIFEKAAQASGVMQGMMKTVADGHTAATQSVSGKNAQVEILASQEKRAEAMLTKTIMASDAAETACNFYNRENNLDLSVTETSAGNFTVSFRPLHAPFDGDADKKDLYPVQRYCIVVANESGKLIFNNWHAEDMLMAPGHYAVIPFLNDQALQTSTQGLIGQQFSREDIRQRTGATMMGDKVVAFVFALFDEKYKKKRNDFDDFLSAYSNTFILGGRLAAVDGKEIKQDAKSPNLVHFTVTENPLYSDAVEYRCIFLPKLRTGFSTKGAADHKKLYGDLLQINDAAVKMVPRQETNGPGFLFNLDIAEQVSSNNYIVAKPSGTSAKKPKKDTGGSFPKTNWTLEIDADTTDNFGNPLEEGQAYLPVILSVSTVSGNTASPKNNWSGYHQSSPVIFKAK